MKQIIKEILESNSVYLKDQNQYIVFDDNFDQVAEEIEAAIKPASLDENKRMKENIAEALHQIHEGKTGNAIQILNHIVLEK